MMLAEPLNHNLFLRLQSGFAVCEQAFVGRQWGHCAGAVGRSGRVRGFPGPPADEVFFHVHFG